MADSNSFSMKWVALSFFVFVLTERALSMGVGWFLSGGPGPGLAPNLGFLLMGLCNVGSYFIGGIIVGIVSPGLRIHEPALGAFLAVAGTLLLSVFSPFTFLAFSPIRLVVGGGIAFFLALSGAKLGERLTGNRVA
jgi:hypothetical protein